MTHEERKEKIIEIIEDFEDHHILKIEDAADEILALKEDTYPKDFIAWCICHITKDKGHYEYCWGADILAFYSIEEIYDYWKESINTTDNEKLK